MKNFFKGQFSFQKTTIQEITEISIFISIILVGSLIESFTWNPITFEINLSLMLLIFFSIHNNILKNIIIVFFLSLLYPFVAYNLTQHSIFLHPLSWVLDFFLVFSLTIPLGFARNIESNKNKNIFTLIYIIIIYFFKLMLHTLSGMVIFGSDSFTASLLINLPYVLVNLGITLLLYPMVIISINKYNNNKLMNQW